MSHLRKKVITSQVRVYEFCERLFCSNSPKIYLLFPFFHRSRVSFYSTDDECCGESPGTSGSVEKEMALAPAQRAEDAPATEPSAPPEYHEVPAVPRSPPSAPASDSTVPSAPPFAPSIDDGDDRPLLVHHGL